MDIWHLVNKLPQVFLVFVDLGGLYVKCHFFCTEQWRVGNQNIPGSFTHFCIIQSHDIARTTWDDWKKRQIGGLKFYTVSHTLMQPCICLKEYEYIIYFNAKIPYAMFFNIFYLFMITGFPELFSQLARISIMHWTLIGNLKQELYANGEHFICKCVQYTYKL